MRKLQILLIFTVLVILPLKGYAQWTEIQSGSLRMLNKIHFSSSSIGFAVPFQGPLLRTTNAGSSWDSLSTAYMNSNVLYENSISSMNDSTVIISTNENNFAKIIITTNRGDSWADVTPSPGFYGTFRLQFFNGIGYACGYNGFADSVWIRYAGSDQWINRSPSGTFSNGIGSGIQMFFVNDSTGYLLGNDGTFSYKAVVLKTTDYGLSWDADTLASNSVGQRLFFPNADTGYLVSGMGGIYKTVNAGASWDTVTTFFKMYSITDIHFLTGMVGYVTTDHSIFKTTDGGKTWTSQYSGTKYLADVHFTAGNQGYVVGDSGLILKINNGLSAKALETNPQVLLFPNPANEVLNLKGPDEWENKPYEFVLYNSVGELIMQTMMFSSISVSELPVGFYYYGIKGSGGLQLASGKLLIAR